MLKLPYRAKLFQGWLMKPWYLDDDSSGENPDGGDDGGTGSETEPGPAQPDDDDDSTIVASNAEELTAALADDNVTDIVLSSDVTATEPLSFYMTSGEKTLDLNGHTITATNSDTAECAAIRVDGGTLTIEGSGSVNGGGDGYSNTTIWAHNDGTIIINDGSYDVDLDSSGVANSCVYASGGAAIIINGGNFRNSGTELNGYYFAAVLNIQDRTESTITCYGGSYRNQNPADGDNSTNTPSGETFLGDGCIVTESTASDGFTVYTVSKE